MGVQVSTPELTGAPPPPVRRDWRVMAWLLASVVSWAGSSAWAVALSWQAVSILPADKAGAVIAISTIPQAILTLLGGVIADRCSTRVVMALAQVGHAVTLIVGALMWEHSDAWWMLLDAATFLLAAAALALVPPRYRIRSVPAAESWWGSLTDGLRYLGRDRRALVFVAGLCGLNVFSAPLTSLGLPLRVAGEGWPAATLGLAEAVFSCCALAGSLAAAAIRVRHQVGAAYACLILQGIAYAGIAVGQPGVLYAAMGVMGLTAGLASVWLSATFVQVVDAAHLGRVASLSNLGDLLLVPLATPAFGALTARVGIETSPLVLAAGMVAMCAAIVARRDLRTITTPMRER